MFGRVDFREDEKKKKNEEGKLFGGCLVGREEKKMVGPRCFLLGLTRKFSPQNREKTRQKNGPVI